MPRLPKESDLEYKRRVIDIKSESFCGAKWYNSTIWLGSGQTTSCHHPLPHQISREEIINNPKALHNTQQKKLERSQMQQGQRPRGCEYCWKIEDTGPDALSDRVYKTVIYSDKDLDHAFTLPIQNDVDLKTLEISFDRTCQFACSYCNPAFSTTWVKDISQNGPYTNLVSDGRNHFTHIHSSSQLFKPSEENPFVTAFFQWWETGLSQNLTELRLTGGEPLMSPETWRLLDWFEKNNTDMKFALNSNLGAKADIIDRLIEATKNMKHFHLYTSNESLGLQAEYIRDGLVWSDWANNLDKILQNGNIEGLHMMCTINALCLDSLPKFLDVLMQYKTEWGKDFPTFTLNILRFPSFQSPLILPREIKQQYSNDLQAWYNANKDSEFLHDMERNHVLRLIQYLNTVETPHSGAQSVDILVQDFKRFFEQYDQRRNKDFCKTFPNLAAWYNSI